MSVGQLFGFDEVLSAITESYPEVRLHISRKNEQTVATASSGGLLAIVTGSASAAPGPIVRNVLVDLRSRLLVRDKSMMDAAKAASTKLTQATNGRRYERLAQIEEDLEVLEEKISNLTDELVSCNEWDLDRLVRNLKVAKTSYKKLTAEYNKLESELV